MAGSRPAPYRRAAHRSRRLVSTPQPPPRSGRPRTAPQRGPRQSSHPVGRERAPKLGRRACVTSRAHGTLHPRFDPDPGPRLRRWGLRALDIDSGSRRGAMEAIGIVINQSPGCRRGMILAPEPAAWLLLPGSGAFGLETFWLGSATSESLRDSDDDVATTEVGLATSEPNEARRRAQRECGTSAVQTGRCRQTCGTRG